MFEDDFPFPKVGYVNSLEGTIYVVFTPGPLFFFPLLNPPGSRSCDPRRCGCRRDEKLKRWAEISGSRKHHFKKLLNLETLGLWSSIVLGTLVIFNENLRIPSRKLTYPPKKWHFEDDFPFPKVGYVNPLEGKCNNYPKRKERDRPIFCLHDYGRKGKKIVFSLKDPFVCPKKGIIYIHDPILGMGFGPSILL